MARRLILLLLLIAAGALWLASRHRETRRDWLEAIGPATVVTDDCRPMLDDSAIADRDLAALRGGHVSECHKRRCLLFANRRMDKPFGQH